LSDLASKIISLSPATTAGSGELNLVGSPSNASGWLSANGGGTLATTSTAGDLPLGPAVTTAIKITSGTSPRSEATLVETNSFGFTTPASYAVKTKVELWLRPGTNFIASEWTVSVYAGSTRQALTTDASSISYLPNASGKYTTYFDAAASTAYTVRFCRKNNAGVNAGVLNVANVIVGPGIQPQGAVVGPAITYALTIGALTTPPTQGAGAISLATFWREGETMVLQFEYTQTAAGSAGSGIYTFPIPTLAQGGGTIDTSRFAAGSIGTGNGGAVGAAQVRTNGTGFSGNVVVYDTTRLCIEVENGNLQFIGQLASGLNNTVQYYSFQAKIPIAEWAGSGTVNLAQNDVEYAFNTGNVTTAGATDSTSFGYGPAGTPILSYDSTTASSYTFFTVQFQTPIQVGDRLELEYNNGSNAAEWISFVQAGLGGVKASTAIYGALMSQGGLNNQLSVLFANMGCQATGGYGTAGTAWSAVGGKWRVRKSSGGQAVGFGAFQAASTANPAGISGLVPAAGLPGRTDGVAVAAGYVGEVVTSGQLGGAITISNSIAALGSQLLHAGSWLIIATASFNGSAGNTYFGAYLGTNPASSTGTTQGETAGFAMVVSANGVGGTITLSKTVNISADTTYYLNCVTSTGTAGSGGILGNIKAVRIA